MNNVSTGALFFDFGYLPHTRHLESVSNSCGIGWRRVYEGERNLIASVTNFSGAATVAAFGYMHDALGRRVVRNGDTFAYNARSELTNAVMNANAYGYGYDGIGNLLFFAAGTVTNAYMANALNQYASITGGATASPIYDPDGNMLTNGVWSYTWDAENRLVGAATNQTSGITCAYDYQGRRFRKSSVSATNTFLYDGWNLYREVESVGDTTVTNIYVWGSDLSGALQGAGGVGGLLAVLRNGTPYFPCYDANGNVTDYVDANGAVVAHREYGPFGRTTVATGPLVHDLHFWFSTKYLDEETGLYYYGERFYSPELMRWLTRDPIEERGGLPLYGFCGNDSVNKTDYLGKETITVPKCHAYLILGHMIKSKPILWNFPDDCAFGGAVGCWPMMNNPEKPDNRWPNVPIHEHTMLEGILKKLFSGTGMSFIDISADDYSQIEQERDFTQAVKNALSQASFNMIADKLCGSSCCCDEVVIAVAVTKGGWEVESGVKPHGLRADMTISVRGKCPKRK